MVRAIYLTGLVAALAQGQQLERRTVAFDTDPQPLDDKNNTLAIFPSVLTRDSPLLSLTPNRFEKRKSIDVNIIPNSIIAAGTAVIAFNAGIDIYTKMSQRVWAQSQANSCTLTVGTIQGELALEGFAYTASTDGKNCDTTSEEKTIKDAVQKCADGLNRAGATAGCCTLTHGGTWTGHLQITADTKGHPASTPSC